MTTTQKLIKTMALSLVRNRLIGLRPHLMRGELASDGRKRNRIAKGLYEEGYIESPDVNEFGSYDLTSKALDDVTPSEPDLIAILKAHEYQYNSIRNGTSGGDAFQHGVSFDNLSLPELAYVIANPGEFGLCNFEFNRMVEFEPGNPEKDVNTFSGSNCVFSEKYDEFVEALRFEGRVIRAFNSNINWGLKTLCNVSEEVAETAFFSPGNARFPRSGERELEFDESADRLRVKSANALELIAKATSQYDAIAKVEKAVALYGGWDKFNNDLKESVAQALRDEDKMSESDKMVEEALREDGIL